MELKVIEKKDNALLSRTKLTLEGIKEAVTPSYDALKKKISEQFNADAKLVAVKHIYPQFGTTKFKVIAYIYTDKELMDKIEPETAEKEKKPAEEKPAEEKKEEKPAEKTEEKPAEGEK